MRLTARDRAIIDFVGQHKCVTENHLSGFIPSYRARVRRLAMLSQAGYIKSRRVAATAKAVYYIESIAQVEHYLAINDIYTAARRALGAQLQEFHVNYQISAGLVAFAPDALMVQRDKGGVVIYAIEADRGTMSLARVQRKLKHNYQRLWCSGLWRRILPAYPVILIVSNRAKALRAKAEAVLDSRLECYLTEFERLAEEGFAGPIWFRAHHKGRCILPWISGRLQQ